MVFGWFTCLGWGVLVTVGGWGWGCVVGGVVFVLGGLVLFGVVWWCLVLGFGDCGWFLGLGVLKGGVVDRWFVWYTGLVSDRRFWNVGLVRYR